MRKWIKKLCSITLAISLFAAVFMGMNISVHAASGKHGNLSWSINNGTLTISGSGDMKEASFNQYPWYNKAYTTVDIKSGVTSIAPYAFYCKDIDVMYLPLSLRTIGEYATYISGTPDIYYAGSLEDRNALLSWGRMNHAVALGTWHYSAHSHRWTLQSTTAATCTVNGSKEYSCHCGQSYTETLAMLGHNYAGNKTYKWTQTATGYNVAATVYCTRNSSHYLNETVTAVEKVIIAPNCTTEGQKQYTAAFTNTVFTVQTKIVSTPKLAHNYSAAVTKPTCTQRGYTTYACDCGYSYVGDYVDALGHSWDEGIVKKEPTCKDKGEKIYTCSVCKGTRTEEIAPITKHEYGDWTKADDKQHKHICSVCQKEAYENHSWDEGIVKKEPTCKDKGEKIYTCSVCKGTRTEEIAPITKHEYGDWTKADDKQHKHICSVCQKEAYENHSWDEGVVTKEPTCKDEGEKTYTCRACMGTRIEPIAKLTVHTYDDDCDTVCNICAAVRTVNHFYGDGWSKDETGHWVECSECGHKKDEGKHIPGDPATETTPQICTDCGYIINPVKDHVHNFSSEWKTDKNGHWHVCSGCEEKDSYKTHEFENACDTDCAICGYVRKSSHDFTLEYKCDQTSHWVECSVCAEKKDINPHEPGAEATEITGQSCTVCGYEIAPALGAPEETEPGTDGTDGTEVTIPTEDGGDGNQNQNEFPWWVLILVGFAAVGVVILLAVRKKKKQ